MSYCEQDGPVQFQIPKSIATIVEQRIRSKITLVFRRISSKYRLKNYQPEILYLAKLGIQCEVELHIYIHKDFPGDSDGKESAGNAGDRGSIPGSGRSPGEGNGYPLQYSCLENSMHRRAW